jgi:DNA-binding NarL/FixJ family response regulator
MKILLVDDHAVVREGYRALLNVMLPGHQVLDAKDGEQTCDILRQQTIDIMVLDINLERESGLVLSKRFLAIQPDVKIIFFSMFEDGAILQRALQAGAMGYISKNNPPDVLISAIKVVAGGQKYIEQSLAVKLANQLLNDNIDIESKLTKREFEIFIAIAMNKSRFDVAEELELSVKTVSNTLTVIKRKLNAVPSEFASIAGQHGYIGSV